MKKLYLIFCIAIIGLTFVPGNSFAAAFAGVSLAPAVQSDSKDVRTRSWFIYNFEPGTINKDQVRISNDSEEEKILKLCAADGYETAQGGYALRKCADKQEQVGAWIKLEADSISLKPGESKLINFIYEVPSDVLPGDYAGGIAAEDEAKDMGNGIALVNRVGVRLYHTVPGERVGGKQDSTEEDTLHPSAPSSASIPGHPLLSTSVVVLAIFLFIIAILLFIKLYKNKKICSHLHKKH